MGHHATEHYRHPHSSHSGEHILSGIKLTNSWELIIKIWSEKLDALSSENAECEPPKLGPQTELICVSGVEQSLWAQLET